MAQINSRSGQVSDHSIGISEPDMQHIENRSTDGLEMSGSEQSIIEDFTGFTPEPTAPRVAANSQPQTAISDAEAGYNQAAYDEFEDSADDGPAFDANASPEVKGAYYDGLVRDRDPEELNAIFNDSLDGGDEDTAKAIDEAMTRAGWPQPVDNEPRAPKGTLYKVMDAIIPDAGANADVPNRGPASVKSGVAQGLQKVQALQEAGATNEEISVWRSKVEEAFRAEGVPDEYIAKYFGDPEPDHTPFANEAKKTLQTWFPPMVVPKEGEPKKEPTPEELQNEQFAKGFYESMISGAQSGAPGLELRGKLPDKTLSPDASIAEILGHGVGQMGSEFPIAAAATVAGTAAAVTLGAPVVAVGGIGLFAGGAVPAFMRKFYSDQLTQGNVKDPADFAHRMVAALSVATSEGLMNVATLGASKFGGGKMVAPIIKKLESKLAQLAVAKTGALTAEIAAAGTAPALLAARLPTKEDYTHAITLIVGFHGLQAVAGKTVDIAHQRKLNAKSEALAIHLDSKVKEVYNQTGIHPTQLVEMMEKDAVLHAEMMSDSPALPKSLEHLRDNLEPKKISTTADYVQADFGNPGQMEFDISGRSKTDPTWKKVEIKEPIPESMGGGEVQLELTMQEQPDLPFGDRSSPELNKIGDHFTGNDTSGEQTSFNMGKDPAQGELGVKTGQFMKPGTQPGLGIKDGIPGKSIPHGEGEQGSLNLPEGYDANRDTSGTQYNLDVPDGKYQPELGVPYTGGSKPKEFVPSESADLGPYTPPKDGLDPKSRMASITPEELAKVSLDTSRAHIRAQITDPVKRDKFIESIQNFERDYVSQTEPVMKLQKLVTGSKSDKQAIAALKPTENPALLISVHRGVVGKAISMLREGTFGFSNFKKTGKGMYDILQNYDKKPEKAALLEEFLFAARSVDYNNMNKESGIDPVHALNVYNKYKDTEIGRTGRDFVAFNNRVLDYFAESGMMSPEEVAAAKSKGEHYVTLYRIKDGESNLFATGTSLQPKGLKGTTGSKAKVQNLFYSTVQHTMELIEQAERNRIATSMVKMLEGNPEFIKLLETQEGKATVLEDGSIQKEFTPLKKGEIAVFENGKRKVFEVPEDVAVAMKAMDAPMFGVFTEVLNASAKALRVGATLSPDFLVRNLARDQVQAWFSSGSFDTTYIPLFHGLKGLFRYTTKSFNKESGEIFDSWLRGGGLNAVKSSLDVDSMDRNIGRLVKETGFMKTAINAVKDPITTFQMMAELNNSYSKAEKLAAAARLTGKIVTAPFKPIGYVLHGAGEAIEASTRLGQHELKLKQSYKKGLSQIDSELLAAYSARNITLDFQRMGAKMKAANAAIPFLNAHVQGLDQWKKTIQNDPKGVLAKTAISVTLAAYLWASQSDDERVKDIPNWQTSFFHPVMTDDWQPARPYEEGLPLSRMKADGSWEYNRGKIFRIPKTQEWDLAATLTYAALEAYNNDDPQAMGAFKDAILKQAVGFDMPQAYRTYSEFTSNYNSFTNRAIVPPDREKLMSQAQYTPYTSSMAKFIANKMFEAGIGDAFIPAPAKTDYLVQSLFGGLGKYAEMGISSALEKLGYAPKNLPDSDWDNLPFVRAFTIRLGQQSRSVETYYNNYSAVNAVVLTAKDLEKTAKKTGNYAELHKFTEDPRFIVAQAVGSAAKETQDLMKEIKAQVEQIHQIPESEITKEEKLRMVDALMWKRIQAARAFNQKYKNAQKEAAQ